MAIADVDDRPRTERSALLRAIDPAPVDPEQSIGVPVRQRVQQNGLDDAEDRGVGADSERERQDSDTGEARRRGELPDREPRIAERHQTNCRRNCRFNSAARATRPERGYFSLVKGFIGPICHPGPVLLTPSV